MSVRAFGAIGAFAAVSAASTAVAQSSSLAGRWVHEGEQQELVIRSSIQQRVYAMPGDFSLGSSTPSTVISTTPTPTRVRRQMAIIVQSGGAFSWIAEKSYDESVSCRVTVHETRAGRFDLLGSEARFEITRGRSRSSRSCDNSIHEVEITPRVDTYHLARSGRRFSLSDGTVSWTFDPYAD